MRGAWAEGFACAASEDVEPDHTPARPRAPRFLIRWLAFGAGFAFAVLVVPRVHAIEGEDIFSYYVGGGLSYDNNLLRLPDGVSSVAGRTSATGRAAPGSATPSRARRWTRQ